MLYFCSTFSMPLGSVAAGHGHDRASVSVLRSKNEKMFNFKFWPDHDLAFELRLKFYFAS